METCKSRRPPNSVAHPERQTARQHIDLRADDDAVLKFEMKPIGEGRAGLKTLDTPIPIKPNRFERRKTQRAVTPFGGTAVFISFLGKIGFVEAIRQQCRSAGDHPIRSIQVSPSQPFW